MCREEIGDQKLKFDPERLTAIWGMIQKQLPKLNPKDKREGLILNYFRIYEAEIQVVGKSMRNVEVQATQKLLKDGTIDEERQRALIGDIFMRYHSFMPQPVSTRKEKGGKA